MPSARRAPREVCRPRPLPLTGRGPASLPAEPCAGHGRRGRWAGGPPQSRQLSGRSPSMARARARGSSRSSTTRIVFSSGARYRPASGSHGARSQARSAWLDRLIHCPTAVNRSFPAAVNAQTATATWFNTTRTGKEAKAAVRPGPGPEMAPLNMSSAYFQSECSGRDRGVRRGARRVHARAPTPRTAKAGQRARTGAGAGQVPGLLYLVQRYITSTWPRGRCRKRPS